MNTCKPAEKHKLHGQLAETSNSKKQREDDIKPVVENTQINTDKQLRTKPCQEALKNKIGMLEKNLNALYSARDNMPRCLEVNKQIFKLREEIKTEKQSLKRKIQNAVPQKKYKDNIKRELEDICHENPEIKKK